MKGCAPGYLPDKFITHRNFESSFLSKFCPCRFKEAPKICLPKHKLSPPYLDRKLHTFPHLLSTRYHPYICTQNIFFILLPGIIIPIFSRALISKFKTPLMRHAAAPCCRHSPMGGLFFETHFLENKTHQSLLHHNSFAI